MLRIRKSSKVSSSSYERPKMDCKRLENETGYLTNVETTEF